TEHLYGSEKLETYLPAHFAQRLSDRDKIRHKREIIYAVARLARKLHAAGLHHQDFYLGHILIAPLPEGQFALYLIDLQRLKSPKELPTSRIVKDLAQLHFSATGAGCFTRTDRLRFMKAYLKRERLTEADLALVRKIEDKSGRIGRHHAKVLARRARLTPHEQGSSGKGHRQRIKSRL
ncbi:MAG: lipopolysaccharide kinase InaA family protein, partial [bacterium]|nr:lipopolysaccharide kinase InaA family protein [bacterium]